MTTLRKLELRRSAIITVKFALATALSLALASLIAPEDPLSTAFFALLTLQPTLLRGLRTSFEQVQATLVATVVTVLVVFVLHVDLTEGLSYVQASLAMGLTALVCIRIFSPGPTLTALFTVLFFSLMPSMLEQSFWDTLHIRFLTVLLGIGTSTLLNLLFSLLRHKDRLYLALVGTSRDLRDLYLELEEILSSSTNPPDRSRLRRLLPRFRALFEAQGQIEVDIEEVRKEATRFRRGEAADQERRAAELRSTLARKMSNITHYGWNAVINLLNNDVSEARYTGLRKAFSANLLKLRQAHRGLEATEPFSLAEEELEGLAQRIAASLKENECEDGVDRLAAAVSLLSNMLHMEYAVVQYARAVRAYVALVRGLPRTRSEPEPRS